jgi:signal transduction histidine kinase
MNILYETTERLLSADTPGTVADRIQHLLDEAFAYPFMGVSFVEDGRILPERVTLADGYDMPPVQPLDVDGESLPARALRSGETVTIGDLAADSSDHSYGDLRSAVCVPIAEAGVIYIGHTEPGPFESFDLHLIDVLAKKAAAVLVRIEREQQLKATKQKAEEASRLKSALLANMSHEIRTPLTSIIGFAGLLESNLSGQDARYAELVHHGGERLMDTLDSVLQLSKLEAGVIEPSSDDVDLVAKAREAVDLYRQRAETAGVALHFDPATESLVGAWDATAVHRVLSNLLSNALKFTPEGGTVTVGVCEHDEQAVVTVADTGIGIGDGFRNRLYDAFTQESDGLEREHEGSGLGLAIVSRLVDLLDGEIDVESTKGEGTCFRVALPLPPADGPSSSRN